MKINAEDLNMNLPSFNLEALENLEEINTDEAELPKKDEEDEEEEVFQRKDLEEVEDDETEIEEDDRETKESDFDLDDNFSSKLIDITNEWQEEGLIPFDSETLPDEIKEAESFDFNSFLTLMKASLVKTKEETSEEVQRETFNRVVSNMPEIIRKGFQYGLDNRDEEGVVDYMRTLIYEKDIKSLDAQNEDDAETIVTSWFKEQGFSQEETKEKLSRLKKNGELLDEAKLVKPKLDKKAEAIAAKKVEAQNELKQIEESRREDLSKRVLDLYSKNTKNGAIQIKGISVDQELAKFLYHAVVADTVPVKFKGKEVEVSLAEAMVLHNKYNAQGSLENLLAALVLMHAPDKFEQSYKKEVVKKETERFIKDHKISSDKKAGQLIENKKPKPSNIGMTF